MRWRSQYLPHSLLATGLTQSPLIWSHSPTWRIRSSDPEVSPEQISARHRQVKDVSVDSPPQRFAARLAQLWQDRPVVYRFYPDEPFELDPSNCRSPRCFARFGSWNGRPSQCGTARERSRLLEFPSLLPLCSRSQKSPLRRTYFRNNRQSLAW